jgi:hypothetical protein
MLHFLPLAVFLLTLKLSLVCAFGGPRNLFAFLKDCVTIGEDHWTWTTRAGEWYEDAEIEGIEQGELVLKHRYGVVRLAIDRLSEKSRHLLVHTQKWADYLASISTEATLTAFSVEPSSTAQAA